jgi:hypothetical protein
VIPLDEAIDLMDRDQYSPADPHYPKLLRADQVVDRAQADGEQHSGISLRMQKRLDGRLAPAVASGFTLVRIHETRIAKYCDIK